MDKVTRRFFHRYLLQVRLWHLFPVPLLAIGIVAVEKVNFAIYNSQGGPKCEEVLFLFT